MRTHATGVMPKSVLIIGSGPVVIGQAAEFHNRSVQAAGAASTSRNRPRRAKAVTAD